MEIEKKSKEDEAPKRVKLYELNDAGQWDDKGTGFIDICPGGDGHLYVGESHLYVRSEVDPSVNLIDTHLTENIDFQKQGETIICWASNGTDRALSFQEASHAKETWEVLCRNKSPQPEEERLLPSPVVENLDQILVVCSRVTLSMRERIANECADPAFLKTLSATFRELDAREDEQAKQGLGALFVFVKTMFLCCNPTLTEILLADDIMEDIFGCLEYDDGIPVENRPKHREFLRNKARFKSVLELSDPDILRKIHLNFRLGYLKDCAMPRSLDDASFSGITTMMHQNNANILEHILADSSVFDDLFKLLPTEFEALVFLQQAMMIVKTMQPADRLRFYDELAKRNVYTHLKPFLQSQKEYVFNENTVILERAVAVDVLLTSVGQQTQVFRSFMVSDASEKTAPFLVSLCEMLIADNNTSLQSQLSETLKLTFDTNTIQTIDREDILTCFYEKGGLDVFFQSLVLPPAGSEQVAHQDEWMFSRQLVCEFLSFCVMNHGYRMKYCIIRSGTLQKVAKLLSFPYQQKFLAVAMIRFIRVLVGTMDDYYLRDMVKHNLFKPLFRLLTTNTLDYGYGTLKGANLVVSTLMELMEYIQDQDATLLIQHIGSKHESSVMSLKERVLPIKKVWMKYQMSLESLKASNSYTDPAPPQRTKSPGRSSDDEVQDSYFEDEEESPPSLGLGNYFAAYEDEDTSPRKSSDPARNNGSPTSKRAPDEPATEDQQNEEIAVNLVSNERETIPDSENTCLSKAIKNQSAKRMKTESVR